MKNLKIKASNRKEAYDIQQTLFKLGYGWTVGEPQIAQYPEASTFFAYNGGLIMHAGDDLSYFDRHENPEETLESLQTLLAEKIIVKEETSQPIKSDGGSSDYYKLTITNKDGESIQCETGDVLRAMVGNDYDLSNVIKACRRMYEASQGRGKEGATIAYDANKIIYFANEFAHWHKQC